MAEKTLKEQTITHILFGIIKGDYLPETLINEKQLCEELLISKSPVREALVDLCSQGVLRSIPRQGYQVVRYTEQTIKNIVQYRILIECGCLDACFDRITPTQLCSITNLVENEFNYLSVKDTFDYWNDTMNFHLTLNSFAENNFIYNQLKSALNTQMRAYLQFYWEKWEDPSLLKPSVLHWKIIECIRDHKKEAAIQFLADDIRSIFLFQNVDGKWPKGNSTYRADT